MFKLRPYQQKAVDDSIAWFSKYRGPGIVVAPTGAGKSLIIAEISNRLGKVLVFQPTKELLQQNFAKYAAYSDDGTIFSAGAGSKERGNVTFATIQTAIHHKFDEYEYLIVDECHLFPAEHKNSSMFTRFLKVHPKMKVLGLTATPFRLHNGLMGAKLDMLAGRKFIWKDYAHITQIPEIAPEFWCPITYTEDNGDLEILKANTSGSEYTEDSVIDYSLSIEEKIYLAIERCTHKSILVFVPSIEQAERMAQSIRAKCVSSYTHPKDREVIVDDFKSGKERIIFNVNIFSVGFDYPELACVIDGQATMSLARYYQRVGRLVRQHPSKETAEYIDLAGNFQRFGKVESLEFRPYKTGWQLYNGSRQVTGVIIQDTFARPDGKIVMPFGKHQGRPVEGLPRNYLEWVITTDMPEYIINAAKVALNS